MSLSLLSQPAATKATGDQSGCTGTSGNSEYATAPSALDATTSTRPQMDADEPHVLQAVDRGSGVVFQRVCQGMQGEVDMQDAANVISLNYYTNDLSYHMVPRDWLAATGYTTKAKHSEFDGPMPSLILTVPTPAVPQAPVFVSQSPITVSKFFSATAAVHASLNPDQVGPSQHEYFYWPSTQPQTVAPSLTSCGQCGLFEFDQGLQCRACNERWLACKVWYRANDGGHKRWLTEP